ncbi:PDR/VanB family oxidoreductase [Salinimonas lutimaris]|uniref:PDR/VanB family oxidoreductase n=1 Tax=Salinimonas lutimaris TaxID=914153 RepID=UPI0010C0F656|nr:PDR/VanB family oxidoreductase [Salinimonas lutimaris]
MLEVIVKRKITETPGIMSFELESAGGQTLPAFEAGSHIDVKVKEGFIRQYSLISHCEPGNIYKIAVLKDAASRGGSVAMHDEIEVGQSIFISEPRNLFPLDLSSQRALLFAGGIGITPIMSMATELYKNNKDFELHYYTRSKEDTAFYQQLTSCEFAARVFFHFDSEEKAADKIIGPSDFNCHLYTCGPSGFMDYVFQSARANGWSEAHLHKENFKADPVSDDGVDKPFKLILSRSGLELNVEATQTALDAIDDAGVEIDMSCEMGVCGTCKTRVLEGIPDHRDSVLSASEKEKNDVFTPCCSRARTDTLIIDL